MAAAGVTAFAVAFAAEPAAAGALIESEQPASTVVAVGHGDVVLDSDAACAAVPATVMAVTMTAITVRLASRFVNIAGI